MKITSKKRNSKQHLIPVAVSLTMLALAQGCTTQRWIDHKKENLGMEQTKYELPKTQERESWVNRNQPDVEAITQPLIQPPEVIKPVRWVEGDPAPYALIAKDDKGEVIPGMVYSPHAPTQGLVDVTGFMPDTEVLCPRTLKPMRVPKPPAETTNSKSKGQAISSIPDEPPIIEANPTKGNTTNKTDTLKIE